MKRLVALMMCAVSHGAAAQLPEYVPTDGLVAWWPMNGNGVDEGPFGNDGSLSSVDSHTNRFGQQSGALWFNGINALITVPFSESLAIQESFSSSVWIYLEGGGCNPRVYELHENLNCGGYNLAFNGTGTQDRTLHSAFFGDCQIGIAQQGSTDGAIPTGGWHHIVLTFEAGEVSVGKAYFDGVLVGETVAEIDISGVDYYGQPLYIGNIDPSRCDWFGGGMDDLGLWESVLDEEDVLGLYNASVPTAGCSDAEACNYDVEVDVDDGSCLYLDACGVCGGDGISGCTDSYACNFNLEAACDDASCDYSCCPGPGCCHEGTIWDADLQQCIVANPADINFDGCVQLNDLLDLLSAYGDCAAEESVWTCGDPLEYQGYDYGTVQIGEQCWLAENLRNELYQNGDSILANLSDEEWGNTDTGEVGATTVFGEPSFLCEEFSPDGDGCDEAWSLTAYGRLYNWYALDDARGLCPAGWHVPSDEEWTSLTDQFGGLSNAGDELKSASGWHQGGDGSNASGFSALPGGIRNGENGSFQYAGSKAFFWTATETIDREFTYWQDAVSRQSGKSVKKGMSVRCLKDLEE